MQDSESSSMMTRALARSMDFRISVWPMIVAIAAFGWYVSKTLDRTTFQNEQLVIAVDRLTHTVETQTIQINTAALAQATTAADVRMLSARMDKYDSEHQPRR